MQQDVFTMILMVAILPVSTLVSVAVHKWL